MNARRRLDWVSAAIVGLLIGGAPVCAPLAQQPATQQPAAKGGRSATERLAEANALVEEGRRLRRDPATTGAAEAKLRQAIAIRREVLGAADPAVAVAIEDLGSVFYNRGQFGEAEALYREALAIAEKALGQRHLDVANILGDLAAALREGRKFPEAEQTVRRSLSIRSLLLGAEHPAVAGSLNNLGRTLMMQGRLPEAQQALQESVRIYEKTQGSDGPQTRQGKEMLALLQRADAAPPPTEFVLRDENARVPIELKSGTTAAVLSAGPLVTPEGWTGFAVVYETTIPLNDLPRLRREVDVLWNQLALDIERSRLGKVVISARAPRSGSDAKPAAVSFAYGQRQNAWHAIESPQRMQAGLDDAFVRAFVAHYDWLVESRLTFAALLYLSPGWTADLTLVEQGKKQVVAVDRTQFAISLQASATLLQNYRHTREIVSIKISPDRKSAEVTSRETETFERGGVKLSSAQTGVDTLVLGDGHATWQHSVTEAVITAGQSL